jgi:hypothetical protein
LGYLVYDSFQGALVWPFWAGGSNRKEIQTLDRDSKDVELLDASNRIWDRDKEKIRFDNAVQLFKLA